MFRSYGTRARISTRRAKTATEAIGTRARRLSTTPSSIGVWPRCTRPDPIDDSRRSLAPGRNDVVRPRVGDQLSEMFVHVAADGEDDVGQRPVLSHHSALGDERSRVGRFKLLLRVRKRLRQMTDHLLLVGDLAETAHLFAGQSGLSADRRRHEAVAFAGD